jgi:trehalose utilization protein
MSQRVRALIWNEFRHERKKDEVRKLYPDGMHIAIAQGIEGDLLEVNTATLDEPDQGISDDRLAATDVLFSL